MNKLLIGISLYVPLNAIAASSSDWWQAVNSPEIQTISLANGTLLALVFAAGSLKQHGLHARALLSTLAGFCTGLALGMLVLPIFKIAA